jgi:hypothetical protein
MRKDDIKKYLVCINGGSGVIYQPSDINFSYILTAKHVFADIEKYENQVRIHRYDVGTNDFVEVIPFQLQEGTNYFPHEVTDIAILRIARLPNCNNLLRIDDFEKFEGKATLFGFPGTRRAEENYLDSIREDPGIKFSINKTKGLREGILPDNARWEELKGQSGGGIFCLDGDCIGVMGIQNRVPNKNEVMGRFEFSPLSSFDELIVATNGVLEPIYPYYLKNFTFLLGDVFRIKAGLGSEELGPTVTQILVSKAKAVANSDLTPMFIKDFFKGKELLLNDQSKGELNKRRIWAMWMELLTLLNIVKNTAHSQRDIESVFKYVRLFYSDIDEDFWINHLDDLARADYSGLQQDGLVVVCSKVPAVKFHELDLKSVPIDIARLKKVHELHKMEVNIDSANDFPFDKFRFANISAFKEGPVVDNFKQFDNMSPDQILSHLKTLYERLIT